MTMIMDSKKHIDSSGGGYSNPGSKGVYQAEIIVSIDHLNKVNILKHRYQVGKKDLSVDESIDVLLDILCQKVYNGSMNMFQEATKIELKEVMYDILKRR